MRRMPVFGNLFSSGTPSGWTWILSLVMLFVILFGGMIRVDP